MAPFDKSSYNLLLFELFDAQYYGDHEICVRGHSWSFKTVPFESWVQFPIHIS